MPSVTTFQFFFTDGFRCPILLTYATLSFASPFLTLFQPRRAWFLESTVHFICIWFGRIFFYFFSYCLLTLFLTSSTCFLFYSSVLLTYSSSQSFLTPQFNSFSFWFGQTSYEFLRSSIFPLPCTFVIAYILVCILSQAVS